jgi:hypothetical protein
MNKQLTVDAIALILLAIITTTTPILAVQSSYELPY